MLLWIACVNLIKTYYQVLIQVEYDFMWKLGVFRYSSLMKHFGLNWCLLSVTIYLF